MIEVERLIADSFARLYPDPPVTADWDTVLDRARAGPKRRARLLARMTIRRRLVLVGGLAGAIGAALLASTMLSDSYGVLQRAQAALDPNGRVLHIVSRWGDDHPTLEESWYLPDGSLAHVVYRSFSGAFGADCVISETQTRCWNPALNVIDVYQHSPPEPGIEALPEFRLDQPESLSRAMAAGYARLLGKTTYDGRAVFAVRLAVTGSNPPVFSEAASHTVYLDRKTYLPVAERMPEGSWTRHFDTFEFLPDTAENRNAIELPAPADATVVVHPVGEYPPEGK
jgi:hypothetical protein